MIAAHNRPEELRTTLRSLRNQTHRLFELLVVDDASEVDLEPVVRAEWSDARFWRHDRNRGYIVARSMMMEQARGEFVLSLDDDSNLTSADAVERAIRRFVQEPELGALGFAVYIGEQAPTEALITQASAQPERYVHTYIGCGHMLRRQAVREIGRYRDFFYYYGEEPEYALRLLNHGWRVLFFPAVVVHHRMSAKGRSGGRIAAHALRNRLWTVLLTLPFPHAAVELCWKTAIGGIELLRLGEPAWFAWAMASFLRGVPRVLRHREPISDRTRRVYAALRYRDVRTVEQLSLAAPPTIRERWAWFRHVWWSRRRARAFWDRRPGTVGRSPWVVAESEP